MERQLYVPATHGATSRAIFPLDVKEVHVEGRRYIVCRNQDEADVMKTWPCAEFSFIRDLLRILSWCKPVFAGIEPILPTSLGTNPRRP